MTEEKTFITHNYRETQRVAEDFAKNLKGRDVIALHGDLGAGKTTFIQGLSKGLGIEKRIISPTFIIMRTYKIKLKTQNSKFFYHIDLYRVENQRDIDGLGIEEIINDPNSIVAIEWAEKMEKMLPEKRIDIHFVYISESERKITISRLSS